MEKEPKPINWKKNLAIIWIGQLLSISGYSLSLPFIPIYIRDHWGITSEQTLGVWMSAFNFFGMLSFCVFTPVWGVLADRYGRKLMLLRAYYLDALLFPCFLLAPNPVWLIVARFVASAFTGTVSAAQTLIVTTTPEEHHGFALGTLSSSIWSGNLLGFAAGGFIVHYLGFTAAFFICGGMYLTAGILSHWLVRDNFVRPAIEHTEKKKKHSAFAGLGLVCWMIFILIILTAMARRLDDPYFPMMIEKIHGPDKTAFHTGWISALAALAGVFSSMGIGRLCDRFSAEKVACPTLLAAGGTMFLQAAAGSLPWYAAGRFFNFLSAGGLEPVFFSMLSKISPVSRRGAVFGLAAGLRMTGILIGSLASGVIIYLTGVRGIYAAAGILFLAVIPVFFLTLRFSKNHRGVEEFSDGPNGE